MADYFDTQPNFTNPAYASPEQLKAQRDYAAELIKRSGQDVNRPTGALANMIDALTGNLTRNNANQIQQQGAQQNARVTAEVLRQARDKGWQGVDPELIGQLGATPLGSPEQRSFVQHLIQPAGIESAYKQPGNVAPAIGAQAPQLPPNYQVGAPYTQGAAGVSQGGVAPPPPQSLPPVRRADPSNPNGGITGGMGYNIPAISNPKATPPANPLPGSGNTFGGYQGPMTLEALAKRGQAITAENARVEGGAKAEAENIHTAVANVTSARQFGQDASAMEDVIRSNPNTPFGPWAKTSNELQRVIRGLPGGDRLIDEKTLAGSDVIEKFNLALAASLQQKYQLNPSSIDIARGSTPGNEKSRLGTLELLDYMKQGAKRDEHFGNTIYPQLAKSGRLSEFGKVLSDYYEQNPLREPNTGHLIMQPVPIKTIGDEQRLGLKSGTPVKLPDVPGFPKGRIGWVP